MFSAFKKKRPVSKEEPTMAPGAVNGFADPESAGATLPPLESGIGNVAFDHAALVGHGILHYKNIYVNPDTMPRIAFETKPQNNEYAAVRHGLIIEALKCIRPYMDFVFSLRGVAGKEDLKGHLTKAIVRFICRYWDMPASKSNHHSYEWGLVLHSLEVACGEAEQATSWNPKTMYGTDDIRLNRDKGKVVCLHFLKGLFHDSHKIYQYGLVARQTPQVAFDPHQFDGNILDFKMVYPASREETWNPGVIHPGRYNAGEFMLLMPDELRRAVPGDVSWEIINALYDMAESEADRDSAQKDAERQGIPTKLELVERAAVLYFTEDRAITKPEKHVFRASPQWFAVNASSFFARVRPPQGVHSNHGARQLFSDFNLLSIKGTDVLKVDYLVRFKDGLEKRESMQLAFVDADFLLGVCPDLNEWAGEIFFGKKDENLVSKFCPLFDNYLEALPEKPSKVKKTATEKTNAVKTAATRESEQKNAMPEKESPLEESAQTTGSGEKNAAAPPAVLSTAPVKWNERFETLLRRFTPSESDPEEGWLYLTHQSAFLRLTPFVQKLAASVTGADIAPEILQCLADNGYPNSPHSEKINAIGRGGGAVAVEGDLIKVTLPKDIHYSLTQKLYSPEAQ